MNVKQPFLFCAVIVSCCIALGGAFASNVDYGILASELILLWIFIGIGYYISKGWIKL